MNTSFPSPLARTLHRWIAAQSPRADHDLLERFLATRDAEAFAALVERHGPLVLRLCRRWLPGAADAEDAFQATFLVLAKKAGSVRRRESLAAWLHGVAYRIAKRMKAAVARRQAVERDANLCATSHGDSDVSWREACTALDEELHRLPEVYRQPLVLFYLQGQLQDAIAAQVGCSPRTLRRRLDRGRELLRLRLARRGVQLAAVLLAVEVSATGVSAALSDSTVAAAGKFAAGELAAVSERVVSLANAVLGTALTIRWALAAAVVLMAGVLGIGAATVLLPTAAESSAAAKALADNGAVPPRQPDVLILAIDRAGKVTPAGSKEALKGAAEFRDYLQRRYRQASQAAAGREVRTTVRITADLDTAFLPIYQALKLSTTVGFRRVELPAIVGPLDTEAKPKAARLLLKAVTEGINVGEIGAIIVQTADAETLLPGLDVVDKFLTVKRGELSRKDDLEVAVESGLKFRHLVAAAAGCRKAGFRNLHLMLPPDVKEEDHAPPAEPAQAKVKPHGSGEEGRRAAVMAGLAWLAEHQSADGSWSLHAFHQAGKCQCTGPGTNDPVVGTAFGLLPLLRAGETHKGKAPRAKHVERGLKFLISTQRADGRLGGHSMYTHGLAALALCEAYGLTADPMLRAPAQRVVDFIVAAQHDRGGWRYQPGQVGDMSVTGWQVQALAAARAGGLQVPEQVWNKITRFLDALAMPNGKGYGYVNVTGGSVRTTASGLLCRLSISGNSTLALRDRKALDGLRRHASTSIDDLYFCYYMSQIMNRDIGEGWSWNRQVRRPIIETQDWGDDAKHPHQKGSWSPKGKIVGEAGGRIMTTSLALLTLLAADRSSVFRLPAPGGKAAVIESLWEDLGRDSGVALPAERTLVSAPAQVVPFLRDRLRPVPRPDDAQIARWTADLGSEKFAVRKQATAELEKLGELAEAALRTLIASKPSLEACTRAERLLARIDNTPPTPEQLRALRAIRILEEIATPEARKFLEALAAGAAEARATQEAQRAVNHLKRR